MRRSPALQDGTLLLEQQISYSYDWPIRHLRHRLVVVPRATHGIQVRNDFGVAVSESSAQFGVVMDAFSNCIVQIDVETVEHQIEFSIWALVSMRRGQKTVESRRLLHDSHLQPTVLTEPQGVIAEIGQELAAREDPIAIGEMACAWAFEAISYEYGVTNVHTTAAAAIAAGNGVCQDYAHVMLALGRAAGVPARYVSGHLVGEGGSHAWVEILYPSGRGASAVGFDPTHNRRVDSRYLAIAVGRDYSDVAPTSGSFWGRGPGRLTVRKRLRPVLFESRAHAASGGTGDRQWAVFEPNGRSA